MGVTPVYRNKPCACGCGRVGRFHTYATQACRQRAYRNRKKAYNDTKANTVSTFLVDLFDESDLTVVFRHLNEVKGAKNIRHITDAMEELSYLIQYKVTHMKKGRKMVS